ncbi:MAG: GTPase HflX [Actinobacteria bacterium]|nr:GTPase HflX [Actinomycetota bacterium]
MALLVFVKIKSKEDTKNIEEEIEELKNLTISAGANIEGYIIHKQLALNPKYFLSTGKLEEIKNLITKSQVDLVIFDEDLTSAQQSNLQKKLSAKVIDRTALILDIFSQRARSREGKLQVELAQLNYILPRLRGKGTQLSRLGGGIGTRGPGEQKLEVDRRKIRKRISQLEEKLKQISIQRDTQRKNREESNVFLISLIGYTNSGKSTLLNSITESDVLVKDMLFSTLDSTTRKMHIPETEEILMTDTVGFIEKLPHQLVASFKSTLEEVKKADLLLLVVDCSNPNFNNHIKSVMSVLKEIEVLNKQILLVFNKIDKLENKQLETLKIKYKNGIFVSALYKIGLEDLYLKIIKVREKQMMKITVRIPYNEGKLISFIYNNCKIVDKKYLEDNIIIRLIIDPKYCGRIAEFIFKDKKIESETRRN